MKTITNECCDCATGGYPCRGNFCPRRHTERWYCDKCGEEVNEYDLENGLCEDCREE